MITLSAFADEISPDLEAALAILKSCGLSTMELRGFSQTNVMKLTEEQVAFAEKTLKREGFAVGSIASPIGKVQVSDAFEPQVGQMKRAIELAKRLDSKYIRIFSFYTPRGEDPKKSRKDVMKRMEELVGMAVKAKLTVVLENEEGLYGDTIERCVDIIKHLDTPNLKLAFDPCNLVIIGPKPFADGWKLASKHLGYMHVKDWQRASKAMVTAGEGDAEWPLILPALKTLKWEGIVALEPHLSAAGQFAGFSGPELFKKAHGALAALLTQAGLEHR